MSTGSYTTTWASHSSMSDFLKCPKSYYLRDVYRDPRTKHKLAIINPSLALGQSVHEVLESLSTLPVEERLRVSLLDKYEDVWSHLVGKKGGFHSQDEEDEYKQRGKKMLQTVIDNPGPIANKAVALKIDDPSFTLPRYKISIEEDIMLCGKIDWMEYMPETNSVHIIDFKTGKHEEDPGSLQLAIYCLLVKNLQKRDIHKVSYWYLDSESEPREVPMPDLEDAKRKIIDIALKMKVARAQKVFNCPKGNGGCYACAPFTAIMDGHAQLVGTSSYQDIYIL